MQTITQQNIDMKKKNLTDSCQRSPYDELHEMEKKTEEWIMTSVSANGASGMDCIYIYVCVSVCVCILNSMINSFFAIVADHNRWLNQRKDKYWILWYNVIVFLQEKQFLCFCFFFFPISFVSPYFTKLTFSN